ncbi:MAG: DNA polymerase III subunit gamma/tau [Candidatus Nealsonbacteria bacterium CG02_land_8_20_14_3_00_37_10]|uniref:DNA polymerase III subunit gamma/tau n=2 Tax=Candidatus Nealsoniibacteriota TaxID=1817911 RepID=A0A2M7DAE0_9BACT|nr:MAG: DNA polymerase III subunit gamma/tau [Candidatus Nealsonbacteria bacterium CG02_land_8_20_14_3_00_37_10]
MSLVLYRKYRPQTFAEVIGQEHVVKTLTNAISSGIISHAYLFAGPRGGGKTTLARLLAKSLNCQNRKEGQSEPCNKCNSCLEIMGNRSLDLIEIDAASHRGIDEIRELRDGIKFAPTKSKYKIFILDEAHQLSKDAANALLKTLEEPPSHVIFVLATTEIHKMIPTIISRCQRFDFRKLTLQEIVKKLEFIAKKEGVKIEKGALELIALNATGSIRDAESIFGQILTFEDTAREGEESKLSSSPFAVAREIKTEEVKNLLGLVEINLLSQFCDFLSQKKASEALNFLNDIIEKGVDLQEFTKSLINYLRQGLILKIMGPEAANPIITGLTKEEFQRLQKQTESFKEEELRKVINLFLEAENKMKYSSIPQLPLELAIIETIESEEDKSSSSPFAAAR